MWRFDCEPYSGEELAEIFFLQAKAEAWEIENSDKIRKLIARNESAFPAYGGDTSRLLYLSSLEASRANLSINDSFLSCENLDKKRKVLTYKDVELGIIALKENKF